MEGGEPLVAVGDDIGVQLPKALPRDLEHRGSLPRAQLLISAGCSPASRSRAAARRALRQNPPAARFRNATPARLPGAESRARARATLGARARPRWRRAWPGPLRSW